MLCSCMLGDPQCCGCSVTETDVLTSDIAIIKKQLKIPKTVPTLNMFATDPAPLQLHAG